jgi:hypothetical protein
MRGLGSNLNELKIRIKKAKEELERMGTTEQPLPEMINTTNILRANEYLTKTDQSKTNLIFAYEEYTKQLEDLAVSLLSIQSDLRDIVKTEASMMEKTARRKPRKVRARKKPRKARTRKKV